MNRLTVKVIPNFKDYELKCMCDFTEHECTTIGCDDYCASCDNCDKCGIRSAINCLGKYEDTGLTPTEIEQLKAENARLHKPVDNIECAIKAL